MEVLDGSIVELLVVDTNPQFAVLLRYNDDWGEPLSVLDGVDEADME